MSNSDLLRFGSSTHKMFKIFPACAVTQIVISITFTQDLKYKTGIYRIKLLMYKMKVKGYA